MVLKLLHYLYYCIFYFFISLILSKRLSEIEENIISYESELFKQRILIIFQFIQSFLQKKKTEDIKNFQFILPKIKNNETIFKIVQSILISTFNIIN